MVYRIGEFSKLGKVPVTTLRYYDRVGILRPETVSINRYRLYNSSQLMKLNEITRYRRAGLSIEDIQRIHSEGDLVKVIDDRIRSVESDISELEGRLELLRYIRDHMSDGGYEIEVREIPAVITAYRKGRIRDQSRLTGFVMEFADICMGCHPDIECTDDGQCFVIYDDLEYREDDIGIQYHQVVKKALDPSDEIGFMDFERTMAVCVKHRGPYDRLNDAYAAAVAWLDRNGMKLSDSPRESYIHGCWDRDSEEDYLTEVIFPIEP